MTGVRKSSTLGGTILTDLLYWTVFRNVEDQFAHILSAQNLGTWNSVLISSEFWQPDEREIIVRVAVVVLARITKHI